MSVKELFCGTGVALWCFAGAVAYAGDAPPQPTKISALGTVTAQKLKDVVPGRSTKAQVMALLGVPLRVAQFNDCGVPIDGQADETWEYRGVDPSGAYRLHVEFDNENVVNLVAKIPDGTTQGETAATAKVSSTYGKEGAAM